MAVELYEALACPTCRTGLESGGAGLRCSACACEYPVVNRIPHLIAANPPAAEQPGRQRVAVPDSGWVRLGRRVLSVPSPTCETRAVAASLAEFVRSFSPAARLANVGSAALRYGPNVLNVDLVPGPQVDVVGDATRLPFRDGSLDGIISRRVLEHVRKPSSAVAEMRRVLKPGGRVWCEIPFLQGYHPTPGDYQRYTRDGLVNLFEGFHVQDVGVALGPSSTLSWVMREWLAILFSFNNPYLYKAGERVFSWLTLPVKYLDLITTRSRFAGQIASSFYLVAERPADD